MERKWFYYRDGKGHGPFTADKIFAWVQSGKLDASTLVWSEGLSRPRPLSEVEVFEGVQSSSDPPPLPTDTSPPREKSKTDAEAPPPLPSKEKVSDTGNESPSLATGSIQSEQDRKTANWMWRASAITLAVLFFSSIIAVFPWGNGIGESDSDQSERSETVKQQKWPAVFDSENRDYLANPQPPSLNEELAEDIGKTFGFKYGQNHSLDRIQREYAGTSIAAKAKLSQLRFRSSFSDTYDYMDSLLSRKWGEEWAQAKRRIEEQSASLLGSGSVSRAKARAFIDTVSNRSEGRLPSPMLETLLMFDPEYIKRPQNIFDDGFTEEYRTGGHPKSKGINLGIEYPVSWKAEEGRRPHVVQKFSSENGRGLVMAMVLVREFPDELPSGATESDFKKAILRLDREKMFGSIFPDTKVIETGKVRLAGGPAIWGRYQAIVNRAGRKIDFHSLTFVMARHSNMVQVMFMAGTPLDNEAVSAQAIFEHYGGLFQRMTNSVEFFGRFR